MIELEKLVVEGSLLGQAKALKGTKEAVNLVNIISSDKMGTFPDLNAAEALGRLPGVSVILEAGEGRFVSIRGARPQYNGTLVNGFTLPSADAETRRNDLVTISNALIETIVVTKAAMPDIPSDGIGGVANILMRNPLDLQARMITASGFVGVNELGALQDRESFTYGDFIGKEQRFAYTISLNRRESDSYYDEIESNGAVPTAGTGGSTVNGIVQFRDQRTEAVRRNEGFDLAFAARLGDHTRLVARGFHSFGLQDQRIYRYTYSGFAPYRVGGSVVDFDADGGLITGRVAALYRQRTWRLEVKGWNLTGVTELGDSITLDYGFSSSRSFEKYLSDFYFSGVRINSYGDPVRLLMNSDSYKLIPTGATSTAVLTNPASYPIASNVDAPQRKDWEAEKTPYVNIAKEFEMAGGGKLELKTGTYLRFKGKANPNEVYSRTQTGTLTFANLGNVGPLDDFDQKNINLGVRYNPEVARGLVTANPGSFGPLVAALLPGGTAMYDAREDIYAGYAMGTYTKQKLTLVAGVRYEKTDEKFVRLTSAVGGFYKEFSDSYDHYMPSVHLKYEIKPDMYIRASWTNTVARPDASNIYSTETIDPVNFTIFSPNPGLEALTSSNFDLSFDWYTGALGQFMVGVFSKDISNFPFEVVDQVVINGNNYRRTSVQANTDGMIRGWEASFRRNFDFLPGFLSGLGLDVNYCGLDSEIKSPLRSDSPELEQQPAYILNASLIYAYKGLFLRLAMSDTGEQIESTGGVPADDEITTERQLWDFTASYDFGRNKNYQLFFEWRNITNEPTLSYWRTSGLLAHKWNSGATIGGGARIRF
ncbi:MAG: TonB-dependent receptor [Opitutaceae bacterium]|nr:TonB-dependent receptor [Opitutaceae bacterium]